MRRVIKTRRPLSSAGTLHYCILNAPDSTQYALRIPVSGRKGLLNLLLDVGIVDAQPKLVEFLLDIFDDLQLSIAVLVFC